MQWDDYSAPFYVFIDVAGSGTVSGEIPVDCASTPAHDCSYNQYWEDSGSKCEECPAASYTFDCREGSDCCKSCATEDGRGYETTFQGHPTCRSCPLGESWDITENACVDEFSCDAGYTKHKFVKRRPDSCSTVNFNGVESTRVSENELYAGTTFRYTSNSYWDFLCTVQDFGDHCYMVPTANFGHDNWYTRVSCPHPPLDVRTVFEDCNLASDGEFEFASNPVCMEDGWSGSGYKIVLEGGGELITEGDWVTGHEEEELVCLMVDTCYSMLLTPPNPWTNTTVMDCYVSERSERALRKASILAMDLANWLQT